VDAWAVSVLPRNHIFSNQSITKDLAALVLRALAPEPSQRFATMDELAVSLQPFAASPAVGTPNAAPPALPPAMPAPRAPPARPPRPPPAGGPRRPRPPPAATSALLAAAPIRAEICDPYAPRIWRNGPAGLCFLVVAVYWTLLFADVNEPITGLFDALAMAALYFLPISRLRRAARSATLKLDPRGGRVRDAYGWSPLRRAARVAAASVATTGRGGSLIVARKGDRGNPVALEVPVADMPKVAAALGLARPVVGRVRVPLGAGLWDHL